MTNDYSKNNHVQPNDELGELRSLLLGVEPNKLNKLYERLDNPEVTAENISRYLPEAVILRTIQDKQLGEAIVPTVEHAIQSSVKKDLDILSTAIFPIMGPAIRKAITTALQEMVQSLDTTLENSFSPQSLKWRLEARQTGKTFAEVVLLRTLIYRVEQVFLIHKKTGLMLQHIVLPKVSAQDPDLVSAMLTAIQDFVKDSFNTQKNDRLQSLHFGELTIWIEEGPQAVLAGIIRGSAPQELRLVFQETIEKIHQKLNRELIFFEGETEPFAASRHELEACLEAQYKSPTKKKSNYAWLLLSTVSLGLGIWSFFAIRDHLRWNAYLEKLNSQPGIVVIQAEKRGGNYFISGMRDSLAVDPKMLVKQANLSPEKVVSHWQPYLSLEPKITSKRVEKLLQPPKTVSMRVDEKGILHVSGSAPQQWILEARKSWRFIPGMSQFQDKNLVAIELKHLESYKKQVEKQMLFFSEGTTEFLPGEDKKLKKLVLQIEKLLETAKYLDKDVRVQIVGHTNKAGTETRNRVLSQARANKILSYLSSQGINRKKFNIIGVANSQDLDLKLVGGKNSSRRVSFNVLLSDNAY
ncbi:OmpA family protein [Mastigocladopsis repens]|uniref:OmpA family protein n=1 Tax=Mastigocladopsis repens TaxID=221287 RepID=UPI0002D5052C|nr:OmpA family protein [Mastigocladopsis repens]